MVVNNSCVMHDRLSGGCGKDRAYLVLFGQHPDGWLAEVHPARLARRGRIIQIGGDQVRAVLVAPSEGKLWIVRFDYAGDFYNVLQRFALSRRMRSYRNVYATEPGSLEVPSAGLHFTEEILDGIRGKGVAVAPITLHIGLSERSRHIKEAEIEQHKVGAEWYRLTANSARILNATRRGNGRLVAVGTTAVRTLETVAQSGGRFAAGDGWSDLFIYPGYRYRAVDAMLTNLHQPRSSHLMLVAAFAGKAFTPAAYDEIIRQKYRFDLFGDCMLIV